MPAHMLSDITNRSHSGTTLSKPSKGAYRLGKTLQHDLKVIDSLDLDLELRNSILRATSQLNSSYIPDSSDSERSDSAPYSHDVPFHKSQHCPLGSKRNRQQHVKNKAFIHFSDTLAEFSSFDIGEHPHASKFVSLIVYIANKSVTLAIFVLSLFIPSSADWIDRKVDSLVSFLDSVLETDDELLSLQCKCEVSKITTHDNTAPTTKKHRQTSHSRAATHVKSKRSRSHLNTYRLAREQDSRKVEHTTDNSVHRCGAPQQTMRSKQNGGSNVKCSADQQSQSSTALEMSKHLEECAAHLIESGNDRNVDCTFDPPAHLSISATTLVESENLPTDINSFVQTLSKAPLAKDEDIHSAIAEIETTGNNTASKELNEALNLPLLDTYDLSKADNNEQQMDTQKEVKTTNKDHNQNNVVNKVGKALNKKLAVENLETKQAHGGDTAEAFEKADLGNQTMLNGQRETGNDALLLIRELPSTSTKNVLLEIGNESPSHHNIHELESLTTLDDETQHQVHQTPLNVHNTQSPVHDTESPHFSNFSLSKQGHEREQENDDLWSQHSGGIDLFDLDNAHPYRYPASIHRDNANKEPTRMHQRSVSGSSISQTILDKQKRFLRQAASSGDISRKESLMGEVNQFRGKIFSHERRSSSPAFGKLHTFHKHNHHHHHAASADFAHEHYPTYLPISANDRHSLKSYNTYQDSASGDSSEGNIDLRLQEGYTETMPQSIASIFEPGFDSNSISNPCTPIKTSRDRSLSRSSRLDHRFGRDRSSSIHSNYSNGASSNYSSDHYLEPLETVSRTLITIPVAAPISSSYFRRIHHSSSLRSLTDIDTEGNEAGENHRKRAESVSSIKSSCSFNSFSRSDTHQSPYYPSFLDSPTNEEFKGRYISKVVNIDDGIDLSSGGISQLRTRLRPSRSSISIPSFAESADTDNEETESLNKQFTMASHDRFPKPRRSTSSLKDFNRDRSSSSSFSSSPLFYRHVSFFEKVNEENGTGVKSNKKLQNLTSAPPLSETDLKQLKQRRHHLALTNRLNHSEASTILGVKLKMQKEEEERLKSRDGTNQDEIETQFTCEIEENEDGEVDDTIEQIDPNCLPLYDTTITPIET